jgi:DNA-binding transcriptional LysR family regulator
MFALRSDSDVAQMAALRAGFGVGACQYGIARRDPNLVPVLVDSFRFDLECWVGHARGPERQPAHAPDVRCAG